MDFGRTLCHGHWKRDTRKWIGTLGHEEWERDTRTCTMERGTLGNGG